MEQMDLSIRTLGAADVASPLKNTQFVADDAKVVHSVGPDDIAAETASRGAPLAFEKAGPRAKIYHVPAWSKAAIVTAGGLCPGLNNVIKSLTLTLKNEYGVKHIYGIKYGYAGLVPSENHEIVTLNEDVVDEIHEKGGTILGSSRGAQDEKVMVDTLEKLDVNMLFCIGGDGTLKCAHKIAEEIKARKLQTSVVGIPKTIDNDISFITRTFGFETAVYATGPIITCAHNEAKGALNGIGLIHVMGRDSGFIAAYAALANTHVNYCLVPEEPFTLEGDAENALFKHLFKRLKKRKHAVIIAAEGAGQDLFTGAEAKTDKSGNALKQNIGLYLKDKIAEHAKKIGFEVNIKYFDPTYVIRSLPAKGTDSVFCHLLAQNAAHAAMAGRTDMVVGYWNDSFTHVPIPMAVSRRKTINTNGQLWHSVRSLTWKDYE